MTCEIPCTTPPPPLLHPLSHSLSMSRCLSHPLSFYALQQPRLACGSYPVRVAHYFAQVTSHTLACGTPFRYSRRIDSCIAQLKAQGPSRTCNESKEEEYFSGQDAAVEVGGACFSSLLNSGCSGRGTRAEGAQGTPTQSHVSPSILVYEENR